MYAGHVAVALALKAREPRLPLIPLALACFGPDWAEVALMFPVPRAGMAIYTHSVPAVLLGAALAALLYTALRQPAPGYIALAWLLHWPADLLTGLKPVLTQEPLLGLDLYSLPAVDFVLESAAIVLGCVLYARRFGIRADVRRVVVILGITLVVLQGAVDVTLSVIRQSEWAPSLAHVGIPTQLRVRGSGPGG